MDYLTKFIYVLDKKFKVDITGIETPYGGNLNKSKAIHPFTWTSSNIR
jgi:hypothetical protein